MTTKKLRSTLRQPSFPRFDLIRALVDHVPQEEAILLATSEYATTFSMIRKALTSEESPSLSDLSPSAHDSDALLELGLATEEITYAHILMQTPLQPYYAVAHILRDALRQQTHVPHLSADHGGWREAARAAVSHYLGLTEDRNLWMHPRPQDTTFAQAVSWFSAKGVSVPLIGDTISLSTEESLRLGLFASRPLISLGDVGAMTMVETLLSQRFNGTLNRLHLHPTPDMMGHKTERSVPHGYLYRIALRTLGKARTALSVKTASAEAVAASTHLGSVYNVEPFSQYETMFAPRNGKVLDVLRKVVIYDELFTIPQSDPGLAARVTGNLFDGMDAEKHLGWSTRDALALYDVLLASTKDYVKSKFLRKEILEQHLASQVGHEKARALIRSFSLGPVNTNYGLPLHARQADTRECMLVRASKNRLWVPGQLFLGPAFYNRLVTLHSLAVPSFGSHIGKAFERHLQRRMEQQGIAYLQGNYGSKNRREGDVDLAIETPETIVLFELKKKTLTRATAGGSDLQLAIDLSQGLVHGVNQLARQELKLRTQGRIDFQDGSAIEWNGRRILKVVLSIHDYGGLHETITVQHALRGLCGVTLTSRIALSDEQQRSLTDANEEFKELLKSFLAYRTLGHADEREADSFFQNVRFLDTLFLERVLQASHSSDELAKALSSIGRMVTGRRDAHFDFEQFRPGILSRPAP